MSTPCLNAIAKAEGIWIEDVAGRRYMDFHGNNVHHIGYGHPRLKRAIAEQMDALPFAPRRYANEPAVALARKLSDISPFGPAKVLFTTGGSDAIEVAVKIARAATGRFKTLSFWDAFHGAGFGAAALSGEALFRSGPAAPLVAGAVHVAPFGSTRCPYGTSSAEASGEACARMIEYVLEREGDIAALVAEPIRAVPYLPPAGFWARVRAACDRHGTLLVFDEIPTGLGKTGAMFACQHDGVAPDILVLGKALGGGILPIAAVLARPELDVGADWAFGHYTHEKNPVTARAALTTIEIIEEEGLVENAARVGAIALERLRRAEVAHSRHRRRARARPAARRRAGARPRRHGAGPRPRRGHHVRRPRPRPLLQDHHGQRADPDAAADRSPRTRCCGARHPRGGNRGCTAESRSSAGSESLSSRASCPGSIVPLAPANEDRWIPATGRRGRQRRDDKGGSHGRQSRVRRAEGGGRRPAPSTRCSSPWSTCRAG